METAGPAIVNVQVASTRVKVKTAATPSLLATRKFKLVTNHIHARLDSTSLAIDATCARLDTGVEAFLPAKTLSVDLTTGLLVQNGRRLPSQVTSGNLLRCQQFPVPLPAIIGTLTMVTVMRAQRVMPAQIPA